MTGSDYSRVEAAIRFLEENYTDQPSLAQAAGRVGLSEAHFQRLFKRWAGVSPKRFVQFLTASHARELLARARPVLETALETGLSGPGRLHDLTVNVFAATPGELKSGGQGLTVRYGLAESPFGPCLIGATERGICHLSFADPDRGPSDAPGPALARLAGQWPEATLKEDNDLAARLAKALFSPGEGGGGRPALALQVRGTNFQIQVWQALIRIPPGSAVTYGDLARLAGRPGAARAAGSAVAKNPVAFLIPCHRVIRSGGAFGQYQWGPSRKKAILGWESAREEKVSAQ